MGTARPKGYVVFSIRNFTGEAECFIHCYPQQKWCYFIHDSKVKLCYKNLDLIIPKADFEKYFVEVE